MKIIVLWSVTHCLQDISLHGVTFRETAVSIETILRTSSFKLINFVSNILCCVHYLTFPINFTTKSEMIGQGEAKQIKLRSGYITSFERVVVTDGMYHKVRRQEKNAAQYCSSIIPNNFCASKFENEIQYFVSSCFFDLVISVRFFESVWHLQDILL